MIFAVLFAASLALIIFFIAALPLGFFEFGAPILLGIVRQYVSIVAVSLFSAVFVRLLVETTIVTMDSTFDYAMLATYLGTLILVAVMLSMVLKLAWKIMDGSFGVMQNSLSRVVAMAYTTSGPITATTEAAKNTASTAVTAATGAAVGFVTGGVAGAFMGGAGGLMSNSKNGNRVANMVAGHASPDNANAQTFVAAARSGGSAMQAATGIIATRRNLTTGSGDLATTYDEGHQIDLKWSAVDMGGYLLPDLRALEQAERAYFQKLNSTQAHRNLVSTYGDVALADEVMGIYGDAGPDGAMWVRGVTETAQISAQDIQESGEPLFKDGNHSLAYRRAVDSALLQRELITSDEDPRLNTAHRIAAATTRQPRAVWSVPGSAPRMMTRDTLDPELPEVQVEDVSAQYALRDLAVRNGWDKPENRHIMDHVFQAYQHTAAQHSQGSIINPEQVWSEMRNDAKLRSQHPDELREAARMVTLIGGKADVQHGEADPERVVNLYRYRDGSLSIQSPISGELQRRMFDEIPEDEREWVGGNSEWTIEHTYADKAEKIVQELSAEHSWKVQTPDNVPATPPPTPTQVSDSTDQVENSVSANMPDKGNELPKAKTLQPNQPTLSPNPSINVATRASAGRQQPRKD